MRRKLFSLILACSIAAGTMPLTACNEQTALNDVQRFAPVVTNLLAIACEFTSSPLCATGAAELNRAEALAFTLWKAYLAAQASGSATQIGWNNLDSALQVLISKSSAVFLLAHVVNGMHQKEVLDVAMATQALLAVIESLEPPSPAATTAGLMAAREKTAPRLRTFLPPPNPKTSKYDKAWLRTWEKGYNSLPAVKARKMQVRHAFFVSAADAALRVILSPLGAFQVD
jgi:hypothetical protein